MDNTENFWDQRYKAGETGWDTGSITMPLKEYIDGLKSKELKILIPGCGNAYEAEYLAEQGFTNVTLIDISSVVVKELKKKFTDTTAASIKIIGGDFFELQGNYDLVLEQTFFCAIDPSLRKDYILKMQELLQPSGILAGVLFNRDFVGGPPFGGNATAYEQLFAPYFDILKLEPCYNSITPRTGSEVFIILQAKKMDDQEQ